MAEIAHEGLVAVMREAVRDFEDVQEQLIRAEARFEVGAVAAVDDVGRAVSSALRDAGVALRNVYKPLRALRFPKDEDVQDAVRWLVLELAGLRGALLGVADSLSTVSTERLADAQLVLRRVRLTVAPHYRALRWALSQVEYEARVKAQSRATKPPRTAEKKRETPAEPAPPTLPPAVIADETLEQFAQRIYAAVLPLAGTSAFFSETKVFINRAYRAMKGVGTLGEFKARLLEANRLRVMNLARADMVEWMNPDDVRESEIRMLGAEFEFIVLPFEPPESILVAGFGQTVREVASSLMGAKGALGNKILIGAVFDAMPHYKAIISNFKTSLAAAYRAGHVKLATDPLRVSDASDRNGLQPDGRGGPVFHFVVVEGGAT